MGRKAGLNDAKLAAVLGEDFAVFSDVERLVIQLADAITSTPANVSDELYARLRHEFSEEQLLELAAQISFENYRARLNRLYNAESDGLYVAENQAIGPSGDRVSEQVNTVRGSGWVNAYFAEALGTGRIDGDSMSVPRLVWQL